MSSFKQKLHVLAVGATLGLGVTAAMLPSAANAALTWTYNNAAANAAEGYVPPVLPGPPLNMGPVSNPMDNITFSAESVIAWHGVPFAVGSTFSDFIVVKVNNYRMGLTPVNEASYGAGFGPALPGDHQITLVIVANGTQLTTNTYAVNGTNFRMDWYWDSGCDPTTGGVCGPGAAPYTFYRGTNLVAGAATDGTLVEQSTLVLGTGVNTTTGLPDGTIDLIVNMVDNLGGSGPGLPPDFELLTGTFALQNILGFAAGNNALCNDQPGGTRSCDTTTASMGAFFAADIAANGGMPFGLFHTQTEGSFVKLAAVPEPGTMLLLGAGLAGLGFGASRKKKAAA